MKQIAGRKRSHTLRQQAHKFPAADVAVFKQKERLQLGMGRHLVSQDFKRCLLTPPVGTHVRIDRLQSLIFGVDFRRDNLDLPEVRANPIHDLGPAPPPK